MKFSATKKGIVLAIAAAALYAVSAPFSKLLLPYVPPTLLAGLLYLGAGIGTTVLLLLRRTRRDTPKEASLTRRDLPYTVWMILLDVAAPIFLLLGLNTTTAANASLLNNFEIVATAIIALAVFREKISPRLWGGIGFVTLSCLLLSFDGTDSLQFSLGSLFILLACACWGVENNCTRRLSDKDPLQIVIVKGLCSGLGSLVIALFIGQTTDALWLVLPALLLGFVSYGLSISAYVYAQRTLGAARTGAYYAVAPFIGALLSLAIFGELPHPVYFVALGLMAVGAWLCSSDTPLHDLFSRKKKPR